MPRQARLDAPGTLHHVIIRGIEKRKIVDDKKDQNIFVERMGQIALDTDTTIYAWALMTNHAHILLKSGQQGLSTFMRRFLTGYAINYNKRHKRYGHLFQNRYKSIVCDEDTYFMELVRYIHLNPLRANIIKDLQGLNSYLYSGHHCIMGKKRYETRWPIRGIQTKLGPFDTKDLRSGPLDVPEMLRKDESNQCDRRRGRDQEDPKTSGTLGSESQTTTQSQFATNDSGISYRLYGFSTSGV